MGHTTKMKPDRTCYAQSDIDTAFGNLRRLRHAFCCLENEIDALSECLYEMEDNVKAEG